ncbi:glycosyltransferase family 4 protein [Ideonella oryzae]|uniref:Glycosyltransferase family 4 protein n=1 Tax=Ideonella oryzae TaxID=2937441 RepID=A0ABT1BKN6_9BURK|nr:glycosyltransferase family 4 protein [Ideonella oryzae]MCO5976673.1 glycosyltransferase family 4 protein [Ideonella oryzae]
MRIIHIETGKDWRGAQVQVLHTAAGQQALGHEVHLVCPPGSALAQRGKDAGLTVHHRRCRAALFGYDVLQMAALMRRIRPHIVHLHSSHAHNVGGMAAWISRVPAVVLSRRMDTPITVWHHKLKYRFGYDTIIAISQSVKKVLVNAGISEEKISVVRSAIDYSWWSRSGERDRIRHEFGYQDSDTVVAVIAAIEPRKGQELLIRALPRILERAPNVKVLLAGKDDIAQPERALASQLGLTDKVTFAGFRPDVKDVIAAADIISAPSYLEGLGVSIMEAMACGKPVVATTAGGIPESVVDGETGILFEPGDTAGLANAIIRLAVDDSLRSSMGQKGQARAKHSFSVDSLISQTLEIYGALLDRQAILLRGAGPPPPCP